MRLSGILHAERRAKYLAIGRKKLAHLFAGPVDSVPVFAFGKQRSGTTMLMRCFHLHPDMEVFDESRRNKAFLMFRIRSFDVLKRLVLESRYPFVCFKPLVETHRILEFMEHFPQGRFIWMYRDYRSVAASLLAKFGPAPSNVLRSICRGEQASGGLADRVTDQSGAVLKGLPAEELSDFDCACLSWWVNNWLFAQHSLHSRSNLMVLKFEDVLNTPEAAFRALSDFTGSVHDAGTYTYVSRKAVAKHGQGPVHPAVTGLCDEMMAALDRVSSRHLHR
ncbi:MAG: hypothetical protein HQ559_02115 [Lentisphaerae bacterium]|nr:hypothetical protein [Lentisphaerota bacterium]